MASRHRMWVQSIDALLAPAEVTALLSTLCIRLGFCLPPAEVERLSASPPANSVEFARAVFISEGLDPVTSDRHLFNQVRQLVSDAFRRHEEESAD